MSIEAMKDARSVILSINSGRNNAIAMNGETVFWQREEWVRWALDEVLPVLEQAIAEAEKQEPVAWRAPNWGHSPDEFVYRDFDDPVIGIDGAPSPNNEPLYTHPQPKREWVGLTDEDFQPSVQKAMMYYGYDPKHLTLTSGAGFYKLVRAIEAKLKEKNT